MKIKIQYKILLLLILCNIQTFFAQKKEENIGTEVVNVVKSYTPTISDAYKIKETPTLDDDENSKKETINYSIFPFPVASTFVPSKGKATGVDNEKEETLYNNYIIGGLGNFLTPLAELYVTENLGSNDYAAGMFKYLSSEGQIKDIQTIDSYLKTGIDLTYGSKQNEFSWNTDLGYQLQKYHWYGLPSDLNMIYDSNQLDYIYNDVDNPQLYNNFFVGGKFKMNDNLFKESTIKYDYFWDTYNSKENRFYIDPSMIFEINNNTISTDFLVDYVGGNFENNIDNTGSIEYGFVNYGVTPSYAIQKDDWSFNVGIKLLYSDDLKNDNNHFYIYPKIYASLKVVHEFMIFYAGFDGDIQQNTYQKFTSVNPFMSPTLYIIPTDKPFDIFAGLKGKLSNEISYNVKGSYIKENDKSLFLSNPLNQTIVNSLEYQYGNSFGIVYDEVSTFQFFGELKGDFSNTISFGINGTFSAYTTDTQQEAWNLPSITLEGTFDYKITEKWFAGASLFFVGERKDLIQRTDLTAKPVDPIVKTLDSYFDINLNVGYKYNEQLTGFVRINNITNQAYEKWMNYPVQQLQVMLGASYKFDF